MSETTHSSNAPIIDNVSEYFIGVKGSIEYRTLDEDASKYEIVRGPLTVTSTWKPKGVQILGPELLKLGNWTEKERLRNLCHEIFEN